MTQIAYLMRHATPDWSRTDIPYDIPPGPPLTAAGEAEAHAAAEFLAKLEITRIYASPLARTHRTAEIVAAHLGLEYTIESAIAEWRHDEDEDAVTIRSRTFWDGLWNVMHPFAKSHGPHYRPLIVTHGGPSRLLLQSLGLPTPHIEHFRAQFDHNNPMPPAGIWRLDYTSTTDTWSMELVFAPGEYLPYAPETG